MPTPWSELAPVVYLAACLRVRVCVRVFALTYNGVHIKSICVCFAGTADCACMTLASVNALKFKHTHTHTLRAHAQTPQSFAKQINVLYQIVTRVPRRAHPLLSPSSSSSLTCGAGSFSFGGMRRRVGVAAGCVVVVVQRRHTPFLFLRIGRQLGKYTHTHTHTQTYKILAQSVIIK